MKNGYKNEYIISSRRNRADEKDVTFLSDNIYAVGDTIELDGIIWDVNEVLDRDIESDAESLIVILVDECGYTTEKAECIVNEMIADNVELVTDNLWNYLTR